MGYHPETGKLAEFGIPKIGDGGREEFNKFRAGFWKETYRRESKILAGELTKRLRKGQITKEEFQRIFQEERQKLKEYVDSIKEIKKEIGKMLNKSKNPKTEGGNVSKGLVYKY